MFLAHLCHVAVRVTLEVWVFKSAAPFYDHRSLNLTSRVNTVHAQEGKIELNCI